MKIVIWLLCILIYSVVVTSLKFAGITLGGLPIMILTLLLVFVPAPALCKLWERRKGQEEQQDSEDRWYTCPKCGQLVRKGKVCDCESSQQDGQKIEETNLPPVQAPRKKPAKRVLTYAAFAVLMLLVVFLSSVCLYYVRVNGNLAQKNISLSSENYRLNGQVEELSAKSEELTKENEESKEKYAELLDAYSEDFELLFFYNNNIGFVVDGPMRYHKPDCIIFKEADTYWAHNIEYCEHLGYSPCPICW